uniref:Uncharacterized protein n=1 Tax=Oryza meridionalis TaxID=40149 RepID=A0A0E0ELR0_9ORYZ
MMNVEDFVMAPRLHLLEQGPSLHVAWRRSCLAAVLRCAESMMTISA